MPAYLCLLIYLQLFLLSPKVVIIQFEKFQLKLDEIINDDFSLSKFNRIEFNVLKLITAWFSEQDQFVFKTSGSTGASKSIPIDRNKIIYSCQATFKAIDPDQKTTSSLLCIDPKYIGGAMVVLRACIMNHNLKVIEPSSNPLSSLEKEDAFDLTSMVPLQFQNSSPTDLNKVKNILIGGASFSNSIDPEIKSNVYFTFGMTETVSHFALRKMDQDSYYTTGDTLLAVDSDSALQVKGTLTDDLWLHTNDIVDLISNKKFRWLGRKDFIINSGGVKLNPESIESKLKNQIGTPFLISYIPHNQLGQQLVLVTEGAIDTPLDYTVLEKYEIPKLVIVCSEIPLTKNGKVDRVETQKMIMNLR